MEQGVQKTIKQFLDAGIPMEQIAEITKINLAKLKDWYVS